MNRNKTNRLFCYAFTLSLMAQGVAFWQERLPRFREQLVDDTLDDLWACAVADVNGDGRRVKIHWNEGR